MSHRAPSSSPTSRSRIPGRDVVTSILLLLLLAVTDARTASAQSPGSVVCWGSNAYGQCAVPPGLGTPENPVVSVSAGGYHVTALLADGSVACWGYNYSGQCEVPDGIGGPGNPVAGVAGGDYHTVAVMVDGSIACWGLNNWGQCDVPAGIGTAENPVASVAAGYHHTVAILVDGSIVCWGQNNWGQCTVPEGVGTPENPAVAVAAGFYHTVALLADGAVACWGWNSYGQCDVPEGVGTPGMAVTSLATGLYHSIAILEDGSVVCWGFDGDGQCEVPPGVGTPANPAISVSAGNHSAATLADGSVHCWGNGEQGQCDVPDGIGTPARPVRSIGAGYDYTVALLGASDAAPIDLCTWSEVDLYGGSAGNWVLAGDCLSVEQTINGEPTYYVSDFDLIDSHFEGTFRVATTGDDDWVGFVFGFTGLEPGRTYYGFFWKQYNQTCTEGAYLCRVTEQLRFDTICGGTGVEVLASTSGPGTGWLDNVEYRYGLDYASDGSMRIVLTREDDGSQLWDSGWIVDDEPIGTGRVGFFNYSQSNVVYSGFFSSPLTPNLIPGGVDGPASGTTGSVVTIAWETINAGDAPQEGGWRDRVWRSADANLDATDVVVGTVYRTATIPIGGSVAAAIETALPSESGNHWYFVEVDADDDISEYGGESDNISAPFGPIVVEYPPLPDLVISGVDAPIAVEAGTPFGIAWSTCNQGDLPSSGFWRDRIHLSADDELDAGDLLLGDFVQVAGLAVGGCVAGEGVIEIPLDRVGTWFLVLETDAEDDIEEGDGETNNTIVFATPISVSEPPLPNLAITHVAVPSTAYAGDVVEVTWTGTNTGSFETPSTWTDRIHLSIDSVLDATDLQLGSRLHIGAVPPGGTWTETALVPLPSTTGARYVIVVADAGDLVEEGLGEGDNVTASSSTIDIQPIPRPNLVASILAAPTSAVAGDTVEITWRVENTGSAPAVGSWSDAIHLSADASLGSTDPLLRVQPYAADAVAPGGAYERTAAIVLPIDYEGGERRLIVASDRNGDLVEESEVDNVVVGDAFPMSPTPAADLAVVEVQPASAAAEFGGSIEVTYRVRNEGDQPTSVAWTDLVLISADGVVNTGDLPVGSFARSSEPLEPGAEYVATVTCELPLTNDLPDGDYRFIVAADAPNAVAEPDLSNNTVASATVSVTRPLLPDLAVTFSGMPSDVAPGEPFDLLFEFTNVGTSTIDGNWFTSIELTEVSGEASTLLQDFITAATIEPGSTHQVVRSVVVPDSGRAEAVVRSTVDSRDGIVEVDESNNVFTGAPAAYRRPDLVAVSVSMPATAIAGETISVVIEGRNDGTASTTGFWTDVVALSADEALGGDRVLGSAILTESISPATGYTRTISVAIPEDLEGPYHPVLTVDPANSLRELDDTVSAVVEASVIEIVPSDRPDLVVSDIVVPTACPSGATIDVSFEVRNDGSGAAVVSWVDRVRFSVDGTLTSLDPVAIDAVRPSALAPGESYTQTVQVAAPSQAGSWRVFVTADHGDLVSEMGGEDGNTALAAGTLLVRPVEVTAAFVEDEIQRGGVLTIRGSASLAGLGVPAAQTPVRLRPSLQGFPAEVVTTTDEAGDFETTWAPTASAAGTVSLQVADAAGVFGDVLDEAVVWGMRLEIADPGPTVPQSGAATTSATVRNLTDLPITGVSLTGSAGESGLKIDATIPGSTSFAPGETRTASILVSAPGTIEAGPLLVDYTLASDQVDDQVASRWVQVVESRPNLAATPARLERDMIVGETSYVDVVIRNIGVVATGELEVLTSPAPWLELVTPSLVEPLEPGAEATISVRLSPPADLIQGPYTATPGIVVIDRSDATVGLGIDTTFHATSTSAAAIEITATSEFTYYGDPPTHPEAVIEVQRASTGELVASGNVDEDGFIRFDRLEPGFYRVSATAESHGGFQTTVNAQGGSTVSVEAFMPRSVVSYTWEVVPIDFGDEYVINIVLDYETNVPAPVITVEPVVLDFTQMTQPSEYVELTVTNHGLIAAQDFRWRIQNTERFEIVPLAGSIGDIPPGASISAPFLLIDHAFSDGVAGGPCLAPSAGAEWELLCGQNNQTYSFPVGVIAGDQECGGTGSVIPCFGCPPDIDLPDPGIGGWGDYNGPGTTSIDIDVCCALNCARDAVLAFAGCHPAGAAVSTTLGVANCAVQLGVGASAGSTVDCLIGVAAGHFSPVSGCICGIGSMIGTCQCFVPPPPQEGGPSDDDFDQSVGVGGLCGTGCGFGSVEGCQIFAGGGFDARLAWGIPEVDLEQWHDREIFDAACRIYRVLRPLYYQLGSPRWGEFEPDEPDVSEAIIIAAFSAVESGTDEGARISSLESASLLSLPLPRSLTEDDVLGFIERWNRSVDYWDAGWTSTDLVPEGLTLDFVDLGLLEEYRSDATTVLAEMEAAGYDRFYDELDDAFDRFAAEAEEGQGNCVGIRIELEQRATITRQAFEARLTLSNDSELPIDGIRIDVAIETLGGEDALSRFAILGPEVTGMGDVDGTGFLDAGASGASTWTIVPGDSAAPDGPTGYLVSGEIVYTYQGQVLSIPLFPVRIDVYPNASLNLQYFIESPVIGDDPFTPEIEPSVPFSLGLWVRNEGGGVAGDVRIESAQPVIVAAESGGEATDVLIDFLLIGSQVNGEEVSPSLDVALGDIVPDSVAVARWLMLCSLQGEFTGYSATVESVNGFDDPEFSIIDAIDINRLEHVVQADQPIDDGIPDFLVDLERDAEDLPDTVFLSSTAIEPVTAVIDPSVTVTGQRSVTINAGAAGGWRFIRIDDPFNAAYRLASVTRGDGKVIQLGSNAWQVDYIDRRTTEPTPRRYVKIFDRGGDGVYDLDFDPDVEGPTVLAWRSMLDHGPLGPVGLELPTGTPASEPRGEVSSLVISFDEPVDAATATAASIALVGLDLDGEPIDPDAFARSFELGAGELSATIGFDPPLPAGRYCIRLVGVADQAGNLLDGETSRLDLAVVPGDASGDLKVNATDGGGVAGLIGIGEIDRFDPWHVRSDLDRDGDIDLADVEVVTMHRPSDLTWLVTTCTVLNQGSDGKSGPTPVAWHEDGTIDHGGVLVDRIEETAGGRPRGGAGDEGREAFDEAVGSTTDLTWSGADGDPVSFPVLLERIAVRSTRSGIDAASILAAYGISRHSIELLSVDGWMWGRLPGHLATPEGHAALAARLAGHGVECGPVVAIGADLVMVSTPSVLLAFDEAVPPAWRSLVIDQVTPGATVRPSVLEGVDRLGLASTFGGDAIADAAAYASRSEVGFAEPGWRLLPLPTATMPSPVLSDASRRWRSLRADFDRDGRVTGTDLEILASAILAEVRSDRFDLTGDGRVDMQDFVAATQEVTP